MNDDLFGQLDLGGAEPLVVVAGVVGCLLWLALAAFVYALRAPPRPPVGPRTLDLGAEPPALANFLVHDFRVTDAAVAATLLDLAARNVLDVEQRGPGVYYLRPRLRTPVQLTPYEQRVLAHVESKASDGVVPADALTTGEESASKEWLEAFRAEVVADAQARGLSRDALDNRLFAALTALSAAPAAAFWAVWGFGPALAVVGGAGLLVGWIYAQHPQRETAAGLDAASRWLGVRAELASNREFRRHSPVTVELWDRLLAYGAALGVASGAAGPLSLGAESDTHAWSSYGGRWREVRVSYPRIWPPGWGAEPAVALGVGIIVGGGAGFLLYRIGDSLLDAGSGGALPFVALCLAVLLGVAVALAAASDLYTSVEITGPLIRLRSFESDDDVRYYAAVDDGGSAIKAFRLTEEQFRGLRQGNVVTVSTTPRLARVRWIVPAPD
jgi:Predicted membrane protein (DUF2207)